jgi:hypothetical protein
MTLLVVEKMPKPRSAAFRKRRTVRPVKNRPQGRHSRLLKRLSHLLPPRSLRQLSLFLRNRR